MSEALHLDPDVEQLLREIAAEPRSSLLRVERPRHPIALYGRSSRIGAGAPGLTDAERHLLAVHRHDVVWLAKEACKWRLSHDPVSQAFLDRSLGPGLDTPILERDDVLARARQLRDAVPETRTPALLTALEQCVGFAQERPSVVSLAVAALRVAESDSLRISMGLGLAMEGAYVEAIECWRRVLELGCSASLRPYALVNLGFAWKQIADLPRGARAFSLAHGCVDGFAMAVLYAFLLGVRLEDRGLVRDGSSRIVGHLHDPEVQASIRGMGRQCRRDGWIPSASQLSLLRSPLVDQELSEMVINALL